MRLVDADKQLEWVDCMTPINGIGLEPVVAVEIVRDLVKGAPTIDAIPVEWLREFDLCYAGITGGTPYMNALVEAWQTGQAVKT